MSHPAERAEQDESLRRLGAFELNPRQPPARRVLSDVQEPEPVRWREPRPRYAPAPVPRWRRMLHRGLWLVLTLAAYVVLRDSLIVSNTITQALAEKTVLVCVSGDVYYPPGSGIWGRLVGDGTFVCTDWKQKRGWGLLMPR